MEQIQISRIDVKRTFLLADAGKKFMTEEDYEKKYVLARERFRNQDEGELNDQIKDKVKLGRYDSMDWFSGVEQLADMGTWPKMKGLPVEFTVGSVIDASLMIRRAQVGVIDVPSENVNKYIQAVETYYAIVKRVDFIKDNFPLILFPGGEVRENDYNLWAGKNNQPLCQIFKYDIDDGNSRALSYALLGMEDAPYFVGVRDSRFSEWT